MNKLVAASKTNFPLRETCTMRVKCIVVVVLGVILYLPFGKRNAQRSALAPPSPHPPTGRLLCCCWCVCGPRATPSSPSFCHGPTAPRPATRTSHHATPRLNSPCSRTHVLAPPFPPPFIATGRSSTFAAASTQALAGAARTHAPRLLLSSNQASKQHQQQQQHV